MQQSMEFTKECPNSNQGLLLRKKQEEQTTEAQRTQRKEVTLLSFSVTSVPLW